ADTEGEEGKTYVWTPAQLVEVLGQEDGAWAAELFGVTAEGTFERGTSTLRLLKDPDDPERWRRVRADLLAARLARPQPARDDKVLAEWNCLAITALAEAGRAFGRPEWIGAAEAAAEFVLGEHVVDGRLRRSSRAGVVGDAAGVLADYGCFAHGLLALHQATGDGKWLSAATDLLDTAVDRFRSDSAGRSGSARRKQPPSSCSARTWSTADCAEVPAPGWSATPPEYSRITDASLMGCWRCIRQPVTGSGCPRRPICSTPRWTG